MASLTGPVYVPAPNPVVPRYGLFSVATGPLPLPVNARSGGLQYEISTCNLPLEYEVECQVDHNTKVIENGTTTVTGAPFVVYSAIRCDTVGLVNWGPTAVERYLFDQLVAGEQATVEHVFSTGLVAQFPSLQSGAVNLGAAQGPVQAVSMLESWLYARYGLRGVIHAPMAAAAYLKGAHLIEPDGNVFGGGGVWRTEVGTAVSLGNYSGIGPTGQAGGNWLYITGQVAIWRTPDSELFVPPMGQVINRTTNVITIVMEREYVLTYDCYSAAVEVTLDTTDQ
jgi:hypothetical protein